jgi:F5/8 type C domain/Fibronectin type III domain
MKINRNSIKKFKPNRGQLPIAAFGVVVLLVIVAGVHLLFSSHAAVTLPTTASVQNMCGVTNTESISAYVPASTTPLPLSNPDGNGSQTPAYPQPVEPLSGSNSSTPLTGMSINTISGTTYLFTETYNSANFGYNTISIANLSNPSVSLLSFQTPYLAQGSMPLNYYFTVDPSGDIFIYSAVNGLGHLYKYSPFNSSGTLTTNSSLTPAITLDSTNNTAPSSFVGGYAFVPVNSSVFGYKASNGNFYIGVNDANTVNQDSQFSKTPVAYLYNTNLSPVGTNNIDGANGVQQNPINGDITSTDAGMMYAYSNTVSSSYPFGGQQTFSMGTGRDASTGLNLDRAVTAFEATPNPTNTTAPVTYEVTNTSIGVSQFSNTGAYEGSSPASNTNQPNTLGQNVRLATVYNGTLYYYADNLNTFSNNNNLKYAGLFSITIPDLEIYTAYPIGTAGTNGVIGLGAGLTTASSSSSAVPHNYFSSTQTPAVNLELYPWWASQASNFRVTYEVRTISQIDANQVGTTQNVSLSSLSSSAPTFLPINLSGNTGPGAYEVSAHLLDSNGNQVGSDCLDYSVGAPGVLYNPSGPNYNNSVEISHELGQNLVRSNYHIDGCISSTDATNAGFNGSTNSFKSMPTIDCSAGGANSVESLIKNDVSIANQYGMKYIVSVDGNNTSIGKALIYSSTTACPGYAGSISDFQCAIYQMAIQNPEVTSWESYNEINNDWSPANAVQYLFMPQHNALVAAGVTNGESEESIIGSFLCGGGGCGNLVLSYKSAGAFNYGTAFDDHAYVGDNRSFEDNGSVIPSIYATATEKAGGLGALQQVASNLPANTSLYNTEYGLPSQGPSNFYGQADDLVRGVILQNSTGVSDTNISTFQNNGCYPVSSVIWGTVGCGHDGGDTPAVTAQFTLQNMLYGSTVSADRAFQQWLPTGTPHTYAALYGASGTDSGSLAVVWADDFSTQVIPKLSGGGTMNITSEFGVKSTLNSGSALNITGQVQYINIPAGQTITFSPAETYGANLALNSSSNLVKASASSTAASGNCSSSNVVLGLDEIQYLPNCGYSQTYGWAQASSDTSPTLTVSLPSAQNIDRVFIGSSTIHSVNDNLRNFTVQVSGDGNTWTTVGTVTNNFFQRNFSFNFTAQSVSQIRVTNMYPNFSGYAGGLAPSFWPTDAASLSNANAPWYGTDTIYDIEAYSPGTGAPSSTPVSPNAPTGLSATVKSSTSVGLSWTASTDSSTTNRVAGYNVFRNNTQINTALVTGTTYTDTSALAGTAYSYTVQAVDNATPANLSAQSASASATTYSLPATPVLNAKASSSTTVALSWSGNTDAGGPGIAAYYITRTNGSTTTKFTVNAPATSYSDTTASQNTTYNYTIQSVDTVGDLSAVSAAASVTTPVTQVIKPSAPTNLSAQSSSSSSVSLSWTASTDSSTSNSVAGYYILREASGTSTYSNIGSSTSTTYTDNTASPSTTYSYEVEAYDNASPANVSGPSSSVNVSTPAAPTILPSAPTNLGAQASSSSSVSLSWTASTDSSTSNSVAGYYILREASGTLTYSNIGYSTSTTYTDNTVSSSTTYSYEVEAYDNASPANVSSPSSSVSVSTPAGPQKPKTPTGLSSTPVSTSQINLSWNSQNDASSYDVYEVGSVNPIATGLTTSSFGVTGLSPNTQYSFYVTAINSVGPSPNSATTTATTLSSISTPTVVTLTGTVSDSSSGNPIAGASVRSGNSAFGNGLGGASTTTNASGVYVLTGMSPNKAHYYHFAAKGYNGVSVTRSYPAGTTVLNETLKAN